MTNQYGPKLPISKELHASKYRIEGESFADMCYRLSSTLSDNDVHRHALNDIFLNQRFMPAGRVQTAIGSPRNVTPWNCLSGDTKVVTKEYGLTTLKQIVESSKGATVLDGDGNWITVPFYNHGVKNLYKVELSNAKQSIEIKATEDHNWLLCGNNVVTTTNLKKGDLIPVLTPKFNTDSISYKKGIVHGLIYGDGNATNDNGFQLRICSSLDDLLPYLEEYPFSIPKSHGNHVYYFFGNNKWTNFKQFPKPNQAYNNYLQASVPSHDLDYLYGFITGWFAADGCVSTQPEVTVCGDLSEYEWLLKWGPIVGVNPIGYSSLSPITNFGERKKKSLNIRLARQTLSKKFFILSKHRTRFKGLRKSWRVKSIVSSYEEIVYCPSVPTTKSFLGECGIHLKNCFVSGTIGDSSTDIMEKAKEAFQTLRLGGGIGYDFSTLRPRGEYIHSIGSRSSGPVSFMDIYDAICGTVSAAGHRRGAQMGVLRVDHPDIMEFIHAKRNEHRLTRFNVSVGITDEFMGAVKSDSNYTLKWGNKTYDTLKAREVWNTIMRSTWDWAEPGVLFIDRINQWNNLWYCETIAATNPCGEQPLPPYGACLLGSFNLVKYIDDLVSPRFSKTQFVEDIEHVVRAMDNIIDLGIYPLSQQEQEGKSKRRMGLGVTGTANALEKLGYEYGSMEFNNTLSNILGVLRDVSYTTSSNIAKEKGTFPLFDKEKYLGGKFIRTLPSHIQAAIATNGIRNSHLLSIAPTGTISLTADNISSGIEPVYTYEYQRTIQTFDGPVFETVSDYGFREWGIKGKRAEDISVEDHIKVLTTAQYYVDSSVSKTCNVGPDVDWGRFNNAYIIAYDGGAKGCTTFRSAGLRKGILNATAEHVNEEDEVEETQACYFDEHGQKHCE